MKNQDFNISLKTIWVLVAGNSLLTIVALYAKIMHWEFSQVMLTVGIMLFFSTWVIILGDMVKNNIYNKSFWVTSMFIFPAVSPLVYLIRRNKLTGK